MSMTNPTDRSEIITSVQRRRRWTASEKVRMVEETFESGMTVSLVAHRRGVAPNQLFTWRRLVAQGGLTAAGSGEEVVPTSDYRALRNQLRELHRLLGRKTLQAEILKEALERATGSKNSCGCRPSLPKDVPDEDRRRGDRGGTAAENGRGPGSVCHHGRTTYSWPRSRRSSQRCRPTATGGSTPSSSRRALSLMSRR